MINIAEHGKDLFDNSIWWFWEASPQHSNNVISATFKTTLLNGAQAAFVPCNT